MLFFFLQNVIGMTLDETNQLIYFIDEIISFREFFDAAHEQQVHSKIFSKNSIRYKSFKNAVNCCLLLIAVQVQCL